MQSGEALRIGFLGAGKMATALARGWMKAGLMQAAASMASDPLPNARESFQTETGIRTSARNGDVVADCELLILAVKPQSMKELLEDVRPLVGPGHFVVSIAAGTTLGQLSQGLGPAARLARVMPNTPCMLGASASGYSMGEHATQADSTILDRLLNAVGRAFRLPEPLLDAVTGLSGSGPAFVYLMIEALSDGGVRMGLPRDVAMVLAAQTVYGSARMVLETGLHPGVLKDMVASPGGTTIAGLHALEKAGARVAFMDAVEMATRRSAELTKG
jgi:pyrroline-5-carboxylate reductase